MTQHPKPLSLEEIEAVRAHLRKTEWGEIADDVCDAAKAGIESDWRPIESAPKDGTNIWVACKDCMRIVYWNTEKESWWDIFGEFPIEHRFPANFWKRLPELPSPPVSTVAHMWDQVERNRDPVPKTGETDFSKIDWRKYQPSQDTVVPVGASQEVCKCKGLPAELSVDTTGCPIHDTPNETSEDPSPDLEGLLVEAEDWRATYIDHGIIQGLSHSSTTPINTANLIRRLAQALKTISEERDHFKRRYERLHGFDEAYYELQAENASLKEEIEAAEGLKRAAHESYCTCQQARRKLFNENQTLQERVAELEGATKPSEKSGWDKRESETDDQHQTRCRHYEFMAYDPDNPDVPLD